MDYCIDCGFPLNKQESQCFGNKCCICVEDTIDKIEEKTKEIIKEIEELCAISLH